MAGKAIKKLVLVGHSGSPSLLSKPLSGEIIWGQKIAETLGRLKVECSLLDLYDFLAKHLSCLKAWQKAENLNSFLTHENEPLFDDFGRDELSPLQDDLIQELGSDSALLFFSWDRNLAPFLSLGLQKRVPLISRCTLFHQEQTPPHVLYESSHLILAESPLASQALLKAGIAKEKILLLPPTNGASKPLQKQESENLKQLFLDKLGEKFGKKKPFSNCLIGLFSRMVPSKNIDSTLELLDQLWKRTPSFTVFFRGGFDSSGDGFDFTDFTSKMGKKMEIWNSEPWLVWNGERADHETVLKEYAACDLLISLSGSEGGSLTAAEWIGLGKPVVLLNASTQHSLFSGAACFVDPEEGFHESGTWFKKPSLEDALKKIEQMVESEDLRREYSLRASNWAAKFSEESYLDRIDLMLESASSYYGGEQEKERVKQLMHIQYDRDMRDFHG